MTDEGPLFFRGDWKAELTITPDIGPDMMSEWAWMRVPPSSVHRQGPGLGLQALRRRSRSR